MEGCFCSLTLTQVIVIQQQHRVKNAAGNRKRCVSLSTLICRHYGRRALCRVLAALLSVETRALDKEAVCRVPHLAKPALGKGRLCRVLFFRVAFFCHSAKMYFTECLCFGTRQKDILPCVFFLALGKTVFQSNF